MHFSIENVSTPLENPHNKTLAAQTTTFSHIHDKRARSSMSWSRRTRVPWMVAEAFLGPGLREKIPFPSKTMTQSKTVDDDHDDGGHWLESGFEVMCAGKNYLILFLFSWVVFFHTCALSRFLGVEQRMSYLSELKKKTNKRNWSWEVVARTSSWEFFLFFFWPNQASVRTCQR